MKREVEKTRVTWLKNRLQTVFLWGSVLLIIGLFIVGFKLYNHGGWSRPSIDLITHEGDDIRADGKMLTFNMAAQSPAFAYPLKISDNRRYLVDQNNRPFFLAGDAAWSLLVQLTESDADYYLADRQQKGFNTIIVSLIEHRYATNAPSDIYGNPPFTGAPFTTPNQTYFAGVDNIISNAAAREIVVLLDPLYLGYQCNSDGWCGEVKSASIEDMQFWGTYVGNRYRDFDNIIWLVGGDMNPSPVKDKVNAFVVSLRQADERHLITAHNQSESMAVTPWSGSTWLTLNNIYTYSSSSYIFAYNAYNYTPAMPFFLLESAYENEWNSSNQERRAQTYWTVLSGGIGHVFGNCPIWHFGSAPSYVNCNERTTDWKSALNKQGSINMLLAKELFNSFAWQNLMPDWDHTVITAGYGRFGNADYATAARSPDRKLVIVYLPTTRTITVDMSTLAGPVTARWYDPSNGAFSSITGSPIVNSSALEFTSPSANNAGDGDWVLVLEAGASPTPKLSFTVSADSTLTPSATQAEHVTDSLSTPIGTPAPPGSSPSRTFLYCVVVVLLSVAITGMLVYLFRTIRQSDRPR